MTINRTTKHRRSREEILEIYKACASQLGKAPSFPHLKEQEIEKADVKYYWGTLEKLAVEAGQTPNQFFSEEIDLNVLFAEFARLCVDLGKIPTRDEFRVAKRRLGIGRYRLYQRFDTIEEFQIRFRDWVANSGPELQKVLNFEGWRSPSAQVLDELGAVETIDIPSQAPNHPGLRPFLPSALQFLNILARGDMPPYEPPGSNVDLLFERRTADAFRCLGFEMKQLGQGTGRKADSLAVAGREHFALIIDAKVRPKGYILGTEDRKFLEYARTHGRELQRQGIRSVYFVVVGPSFKPSDLGKLTEAMANEPSIRNVDLLTATALMRMVENSIRNRSTFLLSDLEKEFFGNKLISD